MPYAYPYLHQSVPRIAIVTPSYLDVSANCFYAYALSSAQAPLQLVL